MLRGEGDFFRTFGRSFSFSAYEHLSEKKAAESSKYFLKLMILATILMFLAAIPAFIHFSKNIDMVMDNFNSLKLSINASSKGPIVIFPGDKFREITIDWESNATTLNESKYLIAKDRFLKKTFFGTQYTNLTGFSNVLEHRETYKKLLMIATAFLIPSMFVCSYLIFGIKFFIMLLALAIIGFIVSRTIRFDIEFKNCFNIAIYSSTIGVLIAMISFPYNISIPYFRIEWIGYALSIVYFVQGVRRSGYFEERRNRGKELIHRRRYIQLREEQ